MAEAYQPQIGDMVYIEDRDPKWYREMFKMFGRRDFEPGESPNAEVIQADREGCLVQHFRFDDYGVEWFDASLFDGKYYPNGAADGFWRIFF